MASLHDSKLAAFPDIKAQSDDTRPSHVSSAPKKHIVKGGHGFAFEVEKGEHFRVVDGYGEQVTDLVAWVKGTNFVEKLSMAYTRCRLIGVPPEKGEYLWTNKDEPIFQVVDDTVRVHDMTFPSCFPELYEKAGRPNHRSCAGNIAEVMKPYGMGSYLEVPEPFNIFMNTPNYTLKRLNPSKPGDYIEFKAEKDAIIAVSSCPYDMHGINGREPTDITIFTSMQPMDETVSSHDL
ncbi:uncharacterized protein PV07_00132 [Cladophialophora immunda]|uniref:DUF1989 domain-containing protein n=1 Tax=Cladophialophora immunda TaxID=569365 RepID=A0A0D2CTK8_9EURO|nr:uncharacterized protein PV07_00132 [Cladophialophora immunda]KIW33265.1 hypothetical protein PV07_00132 [Cladophialophora immunda]OQV11212.1 hypothetical protein CLAIMM_15082 [Cladophialophora immunda]